MVCFDTSFMIALIRRDANAEKKLEEYVASEAKISTTPITACELFKGAYRSRKKENVQKSESYFITWKSYSSRSRLAKDTATWPANFSSREARLEIQTQ